MTTNTAALPVHTPTSARATHTPSGPPAAWADPRWAAIQSFVFDDAGPPPAFSFADRLARENRWTPIFTRRVLDEYRRFLFLAVAAGHPVSPSADVDEAWHLHLTYTHSYWDHLCGGVLRRPLHHQPTRGGAAESAKFTDWYERTLASYVRAFGEHPPTDIWPAPGLRRTAGPQLARVDLRTHWVIRKPRARRLGAIVLGAVGLAGGGAGMAGCGAVIASTNTLALWITLGVLVIGLGILVVILLAARRRSESLARRESHTSTGCSPGIIWMGGTGGDSAPHRNEPLNSADNPSVDGASGSNGASGSDGGGGGGGGGGDGGGGGCGGGGD